MESACKSFQLLLSAYADGEVDARERAQVELHLSACPDCKARLEDLKALSQVIPEHFLAKAEEVDFSGFADAVMRKVTPEKPGFWERLRIAWSEVLTYHRTAVISSAVTAVLTLAVAVPLVYRFATAQQAVPQAVLQELQLDDPRIRPVVMQMDNGKTLIMLVQQPDGEASPAPDLTPEPPKGGDL